MNTLTTAVTKFYPVLLLDKLVSRPTLSILRRLTFAVFLISLVTGLALYVYAPDLSIITPIFGLSLISLALFIEQVLWYSYHNSYYYHGLKTVLRESATTETGVTFELAAAIHTNEADLAKAFCSSRLGEEVLFRSGIPEDQKVKYLLSSRPKFNTEMIPIATGQVLSLLDLGQLLLKHDPSFANMIKLSGVTESDFQGALEWVILNHHQNKKSERWWSRDNLSKLGGLGRDWDYGTPYHLEKFARPLSQSATFMTNQSTGSSFIDSKVSEVAIALARAKAANVLIIGEPGVGTIDILLEVERRLKAGQVIGAVEDQRFIMLDTAHLFATHRDRQALELTLLNLFTEAANAGNVIVVIENISHFIREAESTGVFIPELLDPFLASPQIHLAATDTPGGYHNYLEKLGGFTRRFAEVLIDEPDLVSTTKLLQSLALETEWTHNTIFTYPALVAITRSADQYLIDGVMPERAIELMSDVALRAQQNSVVPVTADFVYQVVAEKTGAPVGPIKESERDLLINLETTLARRVIGQSKAISAIANTMRRARAGIEDSRKPVGSFLFLGPSGVGKTETAKALAATFFGHDDSLIRFDMSEYSGVDALTRLIGTEVESGHLANSLREHPYSVLLLDEFEKAARPVHDLFLQILDEGNFTDGAGDKVNARNTIIIATSNAGADLILRTVTERQSLATLDSELIDYIIASGIYRPELINRFSNTIVFEPLTREEQAQVASLLLRQLYHRVRDRGYELELSRDLIDLLVERGYDPKFGARPMQRVVQDVLEKKIAELIISGAAVKGGTITLARADFQ